MKLRNLLAMSMVVATGLTLASCGGNKVYTGIGYNGSWDAAKNQLDLTAAYVAFDSKGVVVDARIDVVQVKVGLDLVNGGLTLLSKAEEGSVKTKLELGDAYGMVQFGGSIAEVDTQIEAFADWTVGQTLEEIEAKIDPSLGHGTAHHAELEGKVTITCTAFVDAMKVAYANRSEKAYKVSKEAKAGIAMVSNLAYNYGKPQTDISVDIAGVMVDEGKVVASQIDAIVYPLTVSLTDGITPNMSQKYFQNGVLTSKNTLGDKYAMAERNNGQEGCTLEWYEQAEVIENAANGKTASEIAKLVAKEGDLATATITLNNYVKALSKAATYAEKTDIA